MQLANILSVNQLKTEYANYVLVKIPISPFYVKMTIDVPIKHFQNSNENNLTNRICMRILT